MSSSSIQKDYLKKRLRALYKNDDKKTARVQAEIEKLMQRKQLRGVDWYTFYGRMTERLQSADLTINFHAGSWFSKSNEYETYAQTYERATNKGKTVLKDDAYNPAVLRAAVDDMITIPDEWANAHRFSERKRMYKAFSATGASASTSTVRAASGGHAGKDHGLPNVKYVDENDKSKGITTTNKSFKPKAKQVFAALNYGRRSHGSSNYYGFSYIVLKPSLKQDALYYPCDTFYIAQHGTNTQSTFNTLGAVVEYAGNAILDAIYESCWEPGPLENTVSGYELIEAHIFRTVKMNRDVESMVLSRLKPGGEHYDTDEWNAIMNFANDWSKRNKVRLLFASP